MNVSYVAQVIAKATGWQPKPVAEAIVFELDDDLIFQIYSQDADSVFLRSTLLTLPEHEQSAQDICHKITQLALGTCKKMQGIVFIESQSLMFALELGKVQEPLNIVQKTRDFLNELSWWKQQLPS